MRLNVGAIGSDCKGFNDIANIATLTQDVSFDTIELDFAYCDFFDANMAAPLYAVIARLRDKLNDVSISNVQADVHKILRKNKFLSVFDQSDLLDTFQTTLPFKSFKLSADAQFNDYLDIYMRGRGIPTMSEALKKAFRKSLFEIFANATIHSQSQLGIFVCGQFYPRKHRMDFTLADAGVGIWENVRKYLGNEKLDACEAIEWAIREGNTTKTVGQPGGLGLNLIKEFIQINGGKIQIVSRFGYYEFSAKRAPIQKKMRDDFPGTCINIEINTDDSSNYCLKSELTSEDIF